MTEHPLATYCSLCIHESENLGSYKAADWGAGNLKTPSSLQALAQSPESLTGGMHIRREVETRTEMISPDQRRLRLDSDVR